MMAKIFFSLFGMFVLQQFLDRNFESLSKPFNGLNFMFDSDIKAGGSSTSGSTITSFEFSEVNQEYAKLLIGNKGKYFVGLNGDFSFYKVDTEKLDITGASVSNVSGEFKNKEYQLGGYAGMRMDINDNIALVPYAGIFWNKINTKTDGIKYTISGTEYTLTYDNDADDEAGTAIGADIELFKNFTLNIEGRFAAGNAVSFGGTYKF